MNITQGMLSFTGWIGYKMFTCTGVSIVKVVNNRILRDAFVDVDNSHTIVSIPSESQKLR